MIQRYEFFDGGALEFDDARSVRELIEYAFDQFGYYEPFGMEIVTLFQGHHSRHNSGWFTTDVSRTCAEEIENRSDLCFAYNMPGVFYYAEGGWGHHMPSLGNHPGLDNPVALNLRFDDFRNTVVINGNYSFLDVVNALKRTEYLSANAQSVTIHAINPHQLAYSIPLSDPIMRQPLSEFEKTLPRAVTTITIR